MVSKIARASDSMWWQHIAADLPIPGGFANWDEYNNWLDEVLASGVHPDSPRPLSPDPARTIDDEQRDEDFRALTHPRSGWTQTGPDTLEKTDWAGIHHKMTVGGSSDSVVLSSQYPHGAFTSNVHSGMRSADVAANRLGVVNILLPQLAERGLDFHHEPNDSTQGSSVVKRDEDGWIHRITPFKDHRGRTWYSYSGGRSQPSVIRTERDHPSLDAAIQHAMTRQPPE